MARKKVKKRLLHRDMTKPEKRIGFILFLCLCVSFYFVMPFSRVASIRVIGNTDVATENIQKHSGIVINQLVLSALLNQDNIQARLLESYARIDSVSVTVADTNVIELTVKERPTVAYVESDGQYYTVLGNGVVLKEADRKYFGTVPTVKWDDTIESLEIMAKELAKINPTIRQSISEITHTQTDYLLTTLFMSDGNQIKVHYTSFSEKLDYYNNMKKILDGKKGVVDLTVGAYFVPYK